MARIAAANHLDASPPSTAAAFAELVAMPNIVTVLRPEGFLIFRVAGLEADILAFDIAPNAQNQGVGTRMLRDGLARLEENGVREVFLEVDTGNLPALKLYTHAGFFVVGERTGYYKRRDGSRGDAYSMAYYYGNEARIGAAERYRLPL